MPQHRNRRRARHTLAALLALGAVLALGAMPAVAPPAEAGQGKAKGFSQDRGGQRSANNGFERRDNARTAAQNWQQKAPANRFGRNDCPPGLARKNNGCLPPGIAKKQ